MAIIPFYWIDAFTTKPFAGNPAAVCPLEAWLPDETLQQMALQHGLAETAFFVPQADGSFHLRWFTPARKVDLCGHATLASAAVLFGQNDDLGEITFSSQSGALRVRRNSNGRFELDFPSRPPVEIQNENPVSELLAALGVDQAVWVGKSRDYLVVLSDQDAVAQLSPDFERMVKFDTSSIIVTAPGNDRDFVSRNFAPGYGIDEDPVTGSAHCTLAPYWANRFGKSALTARQISTRGGELWCTVDGDRVRIAGNAVTYLKGQVFI
ncbi:MAG: PhzF family phenazine biosynthesis protein [Opitutaceae bacterium]|nr:PhzF family phenazine biosynthesis protein [Opitutaceae bacterium]